MLFDIIVMGGGVVGLTTALSLAKQQFTVALIEQKPLTACFKASTIDTRVFALNLSSQDLLSNLGVWSKLEALRVSPYERMRVWDGKGDAEVAFDCDHRLEDHLGAIVEHQVLNDALVEACLESSWITVFDQTTLSGVNAHEGSVALADGTMLQAKVLVGADGAHSWLRAQLGIPVEQKTYEQHAIVATLQCQRPHQKTAYQCFQTRGPLALLPLHEANVVSLVWSTHSQHAQKLLALSEQDFCHQVACSVDRVLGDITCLTPRASFELRKQHASSYGWERGVLVGDAAHVIHPLAGQGMNLGLLDVAVLVNALVTWRQKGEIHLGRFIAGYERRRRSHTKLMMMAMDAFHVGFTSQKLSLISLRNLGFDWVNRSQWIKNRFIDFALGKNEYTIP